MYFEFDDLRPDITPVGRAISWRDGVLLSLIVHALVFYVLVNTPLMRRTRLAPLRAQPMQPEQPRSERFVFVQPRVDEIAPAPPKQAEASDENRVARAPERAKEPTNPLPFSRGNTRERVEQLDQRKAKGRGEAPEPVATEQARIEPPTPPAETPPITESRSTLELPAPKPPAPQAGVRGPRPMTGGSLGDALQNLQRYVQRDQFENSQGGGGAFGPQIQFDTKGVEFGPWVRRFIAQVKSNWLIPYAAMTSSGRVVITFNVHKSGSITDLAVVGPSPVSAFNSAAYGALSSSNPTAPLPPEYPSDKAFFTVTFFYNEEPQ